MKHWGDLTVARGRLKVWKIFLLVLICKGQGGFGYDDVGDSKRGVKEELNAGS